MTLLNPFISFPVDGVARGTVTYVDATFHKGGSSTNLTVPLPAGAVAGDLLVAHACSRLTADWTSPSGWTPVAEVDAGNTSEGATNALFWRVMESGDTGWTGTWSASRAAGCGVVALRGADPTSPIADFATDLSTGSSTVNFPAVTVAHDDSMLVGGVAAVATATAEPATTTERWDLGSGSGGAAAGDGWTLAANSGTVGPYSGTISGGTYWAAILAAINPAPL